MTTVTKRLVMQLEDIAWHKHETPKGVLRCALNILKDEKRWVKKYFQVAKPIEGGSRFRSLQHRGNPNMVQPAVAFCLIGAVEHCSESFTTAQNAALDALRAAIHELRPRRGAYSNIWGFNDYRKTKHEDVIAALEKAIELAPGGDEEICAIPHSVSQLPEHSIVTQAER